MAAPFIDNDRVPGCGCQFGGEVPPHANGAQGLVKEDNGRGIFTNIGRGDPLTEQAYSVDGGVEVLVDHDVSDLSVIQCVIIEFDNGQKNRARQVPDPVW